MTAPSFAAAPVVAVTCGSLWRWASAVRYLAALVLLALGGTAQAQSGSDCAGSPPDAVTTLPSPLSSWGQVVCTPYGHIITNQEGWIWSNPGSYSPVMIPAQMVQTNPEPLGNSSYFTRISFTPVEGKEYATAHEAINKGFDEEEMMPKGYRLDVTSVSGKSLKLYFFEAGDSIWGIWCREDCDTGSRFMLLNMQKKPNKALQGGGPRPAGSARP